MEMLTACIKKRKKMFWINIYILMAFVFTFSTAQVPLLSNIYFITSSQTEVQIFTVNKTLYDVTRPLEFFIEDVFLQFIGQVNKNSTWKNLSLSSSVDDCSERIIGIYPSPRNLFCINHTTGDVYTTSALQTIMVNSPKPYHVQIQVRNSTWVHYQSYTVVVSKCLHNYYLDIAGIGSNLTNSCSNKRVLVHRNNKDSPVFSFNLTLNERLEEEINLFADIMYIDASNAIYDDFTDASALTIQISYLENTFEAFTKYSVNSTRPIYFTQPARLYFINNMINAKVEFFKTDSSSTGRIPIQVIPNRVILHFSPGPTFSQYCQQQNCIDTWLKYEKQFNLSCGIPAVTGIPLYKANFGFCSGFTYSIAPPHSFTVKHNTINHTKVGSVLTNSKQTVTYFIEYVTLADVKNPIRSALTHFNKEISDCDPTTLKKYSVFRRLFCIDHMTGDLFTTSYFQSIAPATVFRIKVVTTNARMNISQVYNVTVTGPCVEPILAYREIENKCVGSQYTEYRPTLDVSSTNFSIALSGRYVPSYLVALNISSTNLFTLIVNISFETQRETLVLPTNGSIRGKYRLLLKQPIIVHKAGNINIQILSRGSGFLTPIPQNEFILYMLPFKDFCSSSPQCQQLTKTYLQISGKFRQCKHIDSQLFQYKYGRCKGSAQPRLRKVSYTLDLPVLSSQEITNGSYVESSAALTFKLKSVSGPSEGDFASFTPAPEQCTNQFIEASFPPSYYFCINERNGYVYLTERAEGKFKHNDSFILNIEIADVAFPYRMTNATLKFTVTDKCFSTNSLYPTVSTCPHYRETTISRSTRGTYIFARPRSIRTYLGLKFPSALLSINTTSVAVSFSASNVTIFVTKTIQTLKEQHISLKDTNLPKQFNLIVAINEIYKNNTRASVTSSGLFKLLYTATWNYCDSQPCLEMFRKWNRSLSVFPMESNCRDDKYFVNSYYTRCLNIQPQFDKPPQIITNNSILCSYYSITNLNQYVYLLLNDTIRINITSRTSPSPLFPFTPTLPLSPRQPDGPGQFSRKKRAVTDEDHFIPDPSDGRIYFETQPPYRLKSYSEQGCYQCVIYDPVRMSREVKSEKSRFIQLPVPSFNSPSSSINRTIFITTQLTIRGCIFTSPVPVSANSTFWIKNGEEKTNININININGKRTNEYRFENLVLSSVNLTAEGFYQCGITISGTTFLSKKTFVSVIEIPIHYTLPPIVNRTERGLFISGCRYIARIIETTMQVNFNTGYWLFNNTVRINATISRQFGDDDMYTFSDMEVSYYDQIGSYRCVVFKEDFMRMPLNSTTVYLNRFQDPTFLSVPENLTSAVGAPLHIKGCKFKSEVLYMTKDFYLLKNDTEKIFLQDSLNESATSVYEFPEHFINNTKFTDAGIYQCVIYAEGYMTEEIKSDRFVVYIEDLSVSFIGAPLIKRNAGKSGVHLQCSFNASIGISFTGYWLMNNKKIYSAIITYNSTTSRYVFSRLFLKSYSQVGTYQCVVFNQTLMRKLKISNSSALVRFRDPFFRGEKLVHYNTTVMGSITIIGPSIASEAIFTSNDVYWLHLSAANSFQRLNVSSLISTAVNEFKVGDLVLQNVQFNDAGYYDMVIAANGMERPVTSRSVHLTVTDISIKFTDALRMQRSTKTGLVEITGCTVQVQAGLQKNNLTSYWARDDVPLNETKEVFQLQSAEARYSKKPLLLRFINETGFYRCGFQNSELTRRLVKSNVTEVSTLQEPRLTTQPTILKEVIPGSSITIKGCIIDSLLLLSDNNVYWLKDDRTIINASIRMLNKNENNFQMSDLFIPIADSSHEGSYQCAIHVDGWTEQRVLSKKVLVDVKVKLKFTKHPIVKVTENSLTISGCEYQSKKNLDQFSYWLFNDTKKILFLDQNEAKVEKPRQPRQSQSVKGYQFLFPEIKISRLEEFGKYRCVIEYNDTNLMSKEVEITNIPVPSYNEGPISVTTIKNVGDPVELSGCIFTSIIKLEHKNVYWLKDGFQIIEATLSTPRSVPKNLFMEGENNVYQLSKLFYNTSDYRLQGYYQCVIDVPGYLERPVISQKVNVQFQDISDTRVTVKIDQTFHKALLDNSSREFVELKAKVETQITKSLKSKDGNTDENRFVEVLRFTEGSINAVTRIVYTQATNEQRLLNCQELPKLLTGAKFTDFQVESVKVENLDCCHESITGEDSYKGKYSFKDTLVLNTVTTACRHQSSERNYRQCIPDLQTGPRWSEADLKACPPKTKTTQKLLELNDVKVCNKNTTMRCSNVTQLAAQLAAILYDGSVITTQHDLVFTSNIIDNIVTNIDTNTTSLPADVIGNILNSTNNILFADSHIIANAQRKFKSASIILKSLDRFAMKLGQILKNSGGGSYEIGRSRMALAVSYVPKSNLTIYSRLTSEGKYSIVIANETIHATAKQVKTLSEIKIPEEAFHNKAEIIYSFTFEDDILFIQNIKMSNTKKKKPRVVQSSILSATLGDKPVENLTNPVMLRFKKTRSVDRNGNNTCAFWQFSGLNRWIDSGCRKIKEFNTGHVICACDHLTNFALLLDVSQSGHNPIALQIITWIGCGISLAGLALTMLTYTLFANLRKKLAPKLLISLCISLTALLIIFLAGIEATDPREGCQTVAALLQYFMLTTFCWMAVEGVNLYRCFVKVFKSSSDGKFMVKASIFAWGVPVIIVAITAAVEPGNFGNDSFCVLRGYSFYFGVLLPVSMILLANTVVLVLVMRGLSKRSMAKSNKNAQDILRQARIAFMCTMLLGLTWLFGILAVQEATTFFQWLFCIFNSLQGFFIFIFYTVQNRDAQQEWMQCVGIEGQKENSSSEDKNLQLRTKMKFQLSKGTRKWMYNESYKNTLETNSAMVLQSFENQADTISTNGSHNTAFQTELISRDGGITQFEKGEDANY